MTGSQPLLDKLKYIANAIETQHNMPTVHGHVARHGRQFNSNELTSQELELLESVGWHHHKPKQCFKNAQLTALLLPKHQGIAVNYVEGFVQPPKGIPIIHAWISLNGKLVDTTVRPNGSQPNRPIGLIPQDWEYIGVELDPAVCQHTFSHRTVPSLLDDYECRWPLLTPI